MHLFLFLLFGAFCAGGAINLLIQRKTINSALSLIVVMGSLALIYLLLGAEFVAVVQVIIYAGAIMVLYIFVIMLLNAGEEEQARGSNVAKIFGIPGLFAGGIIGIWVLLQHRPEEKLIPIGALYGPADHVQVDTEFQYQDGRRARIQADLRIYSLGETDLGTPSPRARGEGHLGADC